ncbi:MAG TPA: FAD:protein FMN transferase [Bacteroidales bacterium]|nr:FAD:protein FMN transferase [Bacteroidales bacterium]HQB35980.1 FAD:protein FMN transferase [Bacteroidales bacterium]
MKKNLTGSVILLLLISLSCKEKEIAFSAFNGFTQGTTYSITYENPDNNISPEELQLMVESVLYNFDMSLSLYRDSSIVSKINRNEHAVPDTFFLDVFSKSKEVWELTGGAFDITVGPLVKAYGFGPDESRDFRESDRDSLLALVGMEKVDIIDGMLVKTDPRVSLDFNAIAQGYSVDVIARFFDGLGLTRYLIEIGGEVRVRGDRNGRDWRIGIDRPEDNNMISGQELQAIINMKDRSLATSGNYRKFYIENGIKYSHTIDPETGYPARNQLLSATILAGDAATADGVATACMVMGKDKTIEFLSDHPGFEGFLIYSDDSGNFRTWISESLKKNISETN